MIPLSRPDIGAEELAAVEDSFDAEWIALGPKVTAFESEVSDVLGCEATVATNSGTAALELALEAAPLHGDEVLVPPITWISTAHAPRYCDLEVGWVDVRPETLNMDPASLADRISDDTAAVIPVHYAGHPVQLDEIVEIAHEHDALVIEDAAHAFGASYRGDAVGTIGDVGCFSFQESKPVTTGEGGALVTDDPDIERRARRLSKVGVDKTNRYERVDEGGYDWQYDVTDVGRKYFMHDVSAAIGLAQLERLEELRDGRAAVARAYEDAFAELSFVETLATEPHVDHGRYNYTIRVPAEYRDALIDHLHRSGIEATVHYEPLYRHSVFDDHSPDVPVTRRVYRQMVTIPMSSALTDEEVRRVIDAIEAFGREHGAAGAEVSI